MTKKKKAYVKPEIRQVALRAEEAVLGACKNASTSGPAQPKCTNAGGCSTSGS
jgi:hypothetical protein